MSMSTVPHNSADLCAEQPSEDGQSVHGPTHGFRGLLPKHARLSSLRASRAWKGESPSSQAELGGVCSYH